MARDLIKRTKPDAEVVLRKGSSGVFEIRVDGQLAYSKAERGDFPSERDVLECLT